MRTGIDCKNNEWTEIPRQGAKDMSNQEYDYLTGLFRVTGKFVRDKSAWWLFQCRCGNQVALKATEIRYGKIHSCGCFKKELMSEIKSSKLEGQRFGKLLVLESIGSNNSQHRLWKCKCDCGNITYVTSGDLKNGHTISCGCFRGQSKGEEIISTILKNNNVTFIHNKMYFKDLILPHGGIGRYDFIILQDNQPVRIIEFDGIQHYLPTSFYYGHTKEINFEYTKQNDLVKNKYALDHNILLVRIPYTKINSITYEMLMSDEFLIK